MKNSIAALQEEINTAIQDLPLDGEPIRLYEPIRYVLAMGGKRMRPLLTLLGCQLFTNNYQKALKPALAVEVFHNFTLLHDDIMDNAPVRRGKPTVHEKWNENVGILSGDVMLVKAYELLLDVELDQLKHAIQLFNKCAAQVCEGQQFDMDFEERETVTEAEYLNMIRLKTAVLLGYSLELGAIIGGANPQQTNLIREFGVNVGIGFQLMDDLLDVYGEPSKFGKKVGGDIVENKKTFLLIKALEKAEGEMLQELESWLNKEDFEETEKVAAVTHIFNQLNIRETTEAKMAEYYQKGFEALNQLDIAADRKELLKTFTQKLIAREK